MSKKTEPNYRVPALEKGLDVLEALSRATAPQTLAELSRAVNRTSSEIFRMVDALEKRSYIVRDPVSGAYRLTLKMFELAHTHSPVARLLEAARLPMRTLSEELWESCHLSVLDRGGLVVIAQSDSPERVGLSLQIGDRSRPLFTCSGRLLLAYLQEKERTAMLSADPEYRKFKRLEKDELAQQLAVIRQRGYSISSSRSRTGTDLAVVVGNPQIDAVAALGVPCLAGGRNEGKEASLIPKIRQCAAAINAELGFTPVSAT